MKPTPPDGWVYEGAPPWPDTPITVWRIGYWNQDPKTQDPMVGQTIIRDGNYDYVTASVHWHQTPGFTGALPESLYLSTKPAFFGNNRWPWVDPLGRQRRLPCRPRRATTPGSPTADEPADPSEFIDNGTTMNLRTCMIGCGGFARLCHGPSQRRIAAENFGIQLAACCDADAGRAREYANEFGFARSYTDILEMLSAEKPDAVCSRSRLRSPAPPPALSWNAASPCCWKNPGLSAVELDRMIATAEAARTARQVAFNRRHMPVMRKARRNPRRHFPPASVSRMTTR